MPRRFVPITADLPYHITARTVNKEGFKIEMDEAWNIFLSQLKFSCFSFSIEVLAFVLMPNHFHLLCKCKEPNLDKFMHSFMLETSRHINFFSGRINQLYGGSYHKSLIRDLIYFETVYKYVYRNPVAAGLVDSVEKYKYSTLRSVIGLDVMRLPIHDDFFLSAINLDHPIKWINESFGEQKSRMVKTALRHSVFKFPRNKNTKRN
jgi:putative transposase